MKVLGSVTKKREKKLRGLKVLQKESEKLKMTDIAILVAEEFERRVSHSHSRKDVGIEAKQETRSMVSWVSMVAQSVKDRIGDENMEFFKHVFDPKTQIGLAASDGFFSA
ncbi:hypothetical protein PanWU01x14_117790 [Parasponia andersonii]|uniref:Uncharacterized protein n=1 Tax=Parasponia andersonii TaxID=3476 RepID=A0A2P5CW39_PARAD|nr:hypothetical protein PanWU01x14_117790 [Parasponia andersonii]